MGRPSLLGRPSLIGGRRPSAGDIVLIPPTNTNDVRVALAGKSFPALLLLLLALTSCASMPAGAASRYALGAGGVGAARPRGACGEPDLRLALRARRSAHGAARRGRCAPRALRACVPGGAHSRWLPSPPRATRSAPRWRAAPGAWAPIRQPGRGLALRALGTKGVGAARPSAHMCSPGCARCRTLNVAS